MANIRRPRQPEGFNDYMYIEFWFFKKVYHRHNEEKCTDMQNKIKQIHAFLKPPYQQILKELEQLALDDTQSGTIFTRQGSSSENR